MVTTEFVPPRSANVDGLRNKVQSIAHLVDAVNLPELKATPDGKFPYRMLPFYSALRVRELTGVETIFHLTPRDLNRSAIHGILMAAAEAQLLNVLAITGDRYSTAEERLVSKNVYDVFGTGQLIQVLRTVGRECGVSFCIIVGADPTVMYHQHAEQAVDSEIERLLERQDQGAELVQTQPVFDRQFFDFLESARAQGLKIPVLVGLIPLKSPEDCAQIQSRFGIIIPDEMRRRLHRSTLGQETKLVRDLYHEFVSQGVDGVHIYPRERPEYVRDILAMAG